MLTSLIKQYKSEKAPLEKAQEDKAQVEKATKSNEIALSEFAKVAYKMNEAAKCERVEDDPRFTLRCSISFLLMLELFNVHHFSLLSKWKLIIQNNIVLDLKLANFDTVSMFVVKKTNLLSKLFDNDNSNLNT